MDRQHFSLTLLTHQATHCFTGLKTVSSTPIFDLPFTLCSVGLHFHATLGCTYSLFPHTNNFYVFPHFLSTSTIFLVKHFLSLLFPVEFQCLLSYVVCRESNDTECVARQLATLQPHLRHQPRHIFLLDDQCKFQLDSINRRDLTASCVSVCISDALRKWRNEISSSVGRSNFV